MGNDPPHRVRGVLKTIAAAVALLLVRPMRDAFRTIRRRQPGRVFTYPRVRADCEDPLTISPFEFEMQMAYLRRTHDVVALPEAIRLIETRARLRRPVAAVTFDDGYRSVGENARPVMDAFGIPGTAFVCTDFVGTDRRFDHDVDHPAVDRFEVLDWAELAELRAAGWTIGGHTANHVRLSTCDRTRLGGELGASLAELCTRLGADQVPFAYPFGGPFDIRLLARDEVRRAGYTTCFSNHGGENFPGTDAFWLCRIDLGTGFEPAIWKTRAHGIDLARWKEAWRRQ